MDGTNRFVFFLVVLFFAGSVVLMAAQELRDKGLRQGNRDPEAAKRLIQQLRGEYIINTEKDYAAPHALPQRSKGGILQDKDRATLNNFLRQVAPPPEQE